MKYLSISVGMILLAGCTAPPEESGEQVQPAVRAAAATISEADWPIVYEATGTVRARAVVNISSRMPAYVREVRVNLGDRVRQGDVLVVLDGEDLEARERTAEAARAQVQSAVAEADQAVESARASLELADATFRRMKDLFEKRSISNQEFDEANARQRVARAALEAAVARRKEIDARIARAEEEVRAAKVETAYTVLSAPGAGIVTAKNVEPGNLAVPGVSLLTLEQPGGYRLEAEVEETKLTKIHTGQRAAVVLDSFGPTLAGTVSEIVPSVNAASRSFTAKIDLPALPQIRSGLFGRARFTLGNRKTLTIPAAAVVQKGQMQWVYVVENGAARSRLVTMGERSGDRFEALSGVSAGEQVVAPVPSNLADGMRVEIRP